MGVYHIQYLRHKHLKSKLEQFCAYHFFIHNFLPSPNESDDSVSPRDSGPKNYNLS